MGKIRFRNGRVEDYTIVLSTRDYRHLGQITGIKSEEIEKSDNLNSANEISFSINKYDFLKEDMIDESPVDGEGKYVWKQYTTEKSWKITKGTSTTSMPSDCGSTHYTNYTITDSGCFKLGGSSISTPGLDYYYLVVGTTNGKTKTVYFCEYGYPNSRYYKMTLADTPDLVKSDFIGYVSSNAENAHPENGAEGEYWYESVPREELSIDGYVQYQNRQELLWDQIVDFRLIWVKETNEYYEIKVSMDDAEEITKTITGTSLCEAELSQYNLDNLEINSEDDIARDDYVVTTFYNSSNPAGSLLDRVLSDKAPHYTIAHVDESLCKIQRTFSVNGTSIYDFLTGEVAEQFNCLFVFNSANRSISAYDLYTVCAKCGYRGDYYDVCPECGSKNLKYYGEDTTILVDKKNLTDSIHLETNADDIKNCLKMVAGDDLMTATIRLLNQNGSDYLYYISEFQMDDMPDELVQKLQEYQIDYDSKTEEYQQAVSDYYDATDQILYLTHSMMPTIEQAEVTAKTEAAKLTADNLSPLGISSVTTATSSYTVSSALKNYAKIYVKSGFVKLDVNGEFTYTGYKEEENAFDSYNYGYWTGTITVTNYSDEEDVVTTGKITIMVYDKYKEFTEQKILKSLAEESEEDSVFDVLAIEDLSTFKKALTYYSLNRLTSFHDAIQGALDILVQMDQSAADSELYDDLYEPYYLKLEACQSEMDKRQSEIDETQKKLDSANAKIEKIQSFLNFRNYLGEDLYHIYCSYRREDTYENSNYISDGLSNVELIDLAKEFIETANKELKKAAEPQYTITATLKNLLVLDEFKPIIDHFELGNWIRVRIGNDLYRLRLIGYSINFGNLQEISVTFSTITKLRDVAYEAQQITKSAQSIATSFTYVAKQAEKGNSAKSSVDDWIQNGLNSALVNITSEDGNILQNDRGILCRYFDKETGEYSPKQLKILYNNLALTQDNWKTCSLAIGEHSYSVYNPETNQIESYTGYGITSDFLSAPHITGKIIIGGKIYSTNYSDGSFDRERAGTFIDLYNGTFSFAGGGLRYDGENLVISENTISDAISNIEITAENLNVHAANIQGRLTNSQIESVEASKITGTILSSQIEQGTIKAGSIDAENISGQITSSQIESISSGKISGTISSSKIASNLTDKTVSGSFSGDITVSRVTTTDEDGITYNAVTEDIIYGNQTLKFVNGLLVSVE